MLARAPSQVFNEKEMAGLGRQVASTGRLADDAVAKAINALVPVERTLDMDGYLNDG